MAPQTPHIDPYIFERQFEAFSAFVYEKSGVPFVSFGSNPYVVAQEGYKNDIYLSGRRALAVDTWKASDIGKGRIARSVISAIEIHGNNLVPWEARYGEEQRPHQPLVAAVEHPHEVHSIENTLFTLYCGEQDEQAFAELTVVFGKRYSLLAYLLFLKDRSRYLPIATTTFDDAFRFLGTDFRTSRQCSWANYSVFRSLIDELKPMLTVRVAGEVTLLDAHSFAWMLARQMQRANRAADVREYLNLSASERDAIVKARVGQGRFREDLIRYWSRCAVTNRT